MASWSDQAVGKDECRDTGAKHGAQPAVPCGSGLCVAGPDRTNGGPPHERAADDALGAAGRRERRAGARARAGGRAAVVVAEKNFNTVLMLMYSMLNYCTGYKTFYC